MHNITIISTVHRENGKCDADELCTILERTRPEVIFLEALEDTYSKYQQSIFSSFGVYHQKLEVEAVQKYSHISDFDYVPVLDAGLSDSFNKKYDLVCKNIELQIKIDKFDRLASEQGFQFLNSAGSVLLLEEMREYENLILKDNKLNEVAFKDVDSYENSMIHNIYSYSRNKTFNKAVFLCGVAHRKSIIAKVKTSNNKEKIDLNWEIYDN